MNPKVDKFFNFMEYQGVSKGCNRESYNSLTKIEACKEQVFIFTIKPKKIQDHQIIVVAEIWGVIVPAHTVIMNVSTNEKDRQKPLY